MAHKPKASQPQSPTLLPHERASSTGATQPSLRQSFKVIRPFPCPNTRRWHKKDEQVALLPCEAQQLLLTGKIEPANSPSIALSASKEKTDA